MRLAFSFAVLTLAVSCASVKQSRSVSSVPAEPSINGTYVGSLVDE